MLTDESIAGYFSAAANLRSETQQLLTSLIECPSPTGEEAEFAHLLCTLMQRHGLDSHVNEIYEGRFNVFGTLEGDRLGPTILLSGHLDTSTRGDEDWLQGAGWKNRAVVEGDTVWGNGIFNMKSAFASYLLAIDAIRAGGRDWPGRIIMAGTAGEIELASVDEFTGRRFDSYGVGMRHALTHGLAADYHILGEPTRFQVHIGNMGSAWAKVTTTGSFSHTAFSDGSTNAIDEMIALWTGLNEWIETHREKAQFMGVKAPVNRAAIRGGLAWRAARTPPTCSAYFDIRFSPKMFPIDIQRSFEAAVERVAAERLAAPPRVEWYLSRPGTVISPRQPVVQSIATAHSKVFGKTVIPTFSAPVCSDAIDANRYGVPTVLYGVRRAGGHVAKDGAKGVVTRDPRGTEGESVSITDVISAAKVYALACAELLRGGIPGTDSARDYEMPGATEAVNTPDTVSV